MKSIAPAIVALLICGCAATVVKGPGTVTITGRVIERSEVGASPKHAVNESHTIGTGGAFGMMLAGMMGRPKYTVHNVADANGKVHIARSQTGFPIGACVDIVVPREKLEEKMWDVGEVGLESSLACK